ncbi:unnamed protein product [Pleuronectes platessa]|uniref:Uncharacterized protein n=1 Tax=Pleuronectes platessa TaxID=8262 RepID=A0A9N7VJL7_PLEPL|nr:unnamed protein product [Pleuronectes platessa]
MGASGKRQERRMEAPAGPATDKTALGNLTLSPWIKAVCLFLGRLSTPTGLVHCSTRSPPRHRCTYEGLRREGAEGLAKEATSNVLAGRRVVGGLALQPLVSPSAQTSDPS